MRWPVSFRYYQAKSFSRLEKRIDKRFFASSSSWSCVSQKNNDFPEMTDHMMMTLSIFCGNLKCPSWTNKLFGNHNINLEINSEKFLELFDVSQHQGIQAQEPVLGSVVTVWSWYGAVRSVRESLTATIS